MLIFASALAAFIPMTVYLLLIWRFDKYDREPLKLVLTNYIWGAVGAIVLAIIGGLAISFFLSFVVSNPADLDYIGTIGVAPFVEEMTKGAFLLITVANRRFDNVTDGIVYGGAIGLGFGMTENFLYFISYGTDLPNFISIVIIRTLFSAVMHCISTATLGAFIGFAKFKSFTYKVVLTIAGLLSAMLIHFAWNFSISFEKTAPLGFLFIFLSVLIFIAVFIASVMGERRIIFKELSEETRFGTIPENHLLILSSSKRDKAGWIDETIRKHYIKAATTLAFRKSQLKYSRGASRVYYENDVLKYRDFITNLLNSISKV